MAQPPRFWEEAWNTIVPLLQSGEVKPILAAALVRPFLFIEKERIMSQETILVTGAAGGVGSTARVAIAILLKQGHRVRAMVRTLDGRADSLQELGAEVVVADMLDIVAVRAAMRDCSVVYFTMSVSPNYLEAAANVAVTAKGLGVKAYVNLAQMTLSQMSETEITSSPQQKQEWLAQQMLQWSRLRVVYLRPTAFFEMFLLQGQEHPRQQRHPLPVRRWQDLADRCRRRGRRWRCCTG